MIGVVRNLWAKRLAALIVLAGVLIQATLGLPVTLRMAADAAPVCSIQHSADRDGRSSHPAHSHARCLLCQTSSAPPLASGAVPTPLPAPAGWAAPLPAGVAHFALQPVTLGFSSRAPPALA